MPPSCSFSDARQIITDENGALGIYPLDVGGGFVSSTAYGTSNGTTTVLQHCSSGRYLLIAYPQNKADEIDPIYDEMVFGDGEYTFRQIGDALGALGASARMGENDIGTCACEIYYGASQ